jgi:hypothetical protein
MSYLIIHYYASKKFPFQRNTILRRAQYVIIRTDGVEIQLLVYRLLGQFTYWRQSYVRNYSLSVPPLGPTLQKIISAWKSGRDMKLTTERCIVAWPS